MDKVIFLDRDGVINVDLMGDYIKTVDEFQFEEGAIEALQLLQDARFKMIIISNQAGVGDGVFTQEALNEVHTHMLQELGKRCIHIDSTFYCLHAKKGDCGCRKPKIGLFQQATLALEYDPTESFYIGDKATDIEAGKKFGLKTIFVRTGHGVNDESKFNETLSPDHRADNLLQAVQQFVL